MLEALFGLQQGQLG